VSLFNGLPEQGPGIIRLNPNGSGITPVVSTFVPNISVAVHKGFIYMGTVTGMVYRVKG